MVVGLGIDIVDIARARRMLATHGQRILQRVCTEAEAEYVGSRGDGSESLAARLAAKEAAFKALAGTMDARAIGWREIEVLAANGGPPALRFHGRAKQRAEELGVRRTWLSLTHSDASAVATVILEGFDGALPHNDGPGELTRE
jgi:holo-[acyl-carrier protein] synthase